ncbi:P-type DNA transfer protein VirB5 [Xenorhabdus budapestensis]|uniref:Type IV secretion system protein VirB5 n=1 Tax=Xenorhabdus budapestensis TaxID=290110 RepID=A0A2D0IT65_XENBU|nr:P-type DNA transfer protein VirB5 [Xenorhabdus budapestensis]PHM25049.1 type IV secretion system protein VirB5 [Xenorhabdus budapestensis]
MKKSLTAMVIALGIGLTPVITAASGIPTIDVANIAQLAANAKQQADEALLQLNKTKEAIQQAKSQYDHYKGLVTGNDQLGNFLNDPLLNNVLPINDWSNIYTRTKNLADLRNRYGLTSRDPNVQKSFDHLLSQAGALEDTYNAASQRIKNAEQLRQKLNTVQTPQQREELALRLQQEQLELQNQQIQLQNVKMLMDQQEKLADKKRAQDLWDYAVGNTKKLPTCN